MTTLPKIAKVKTIMINQLENIIINSSLYLYKTGELD